MQTKEAKTKYRARASLCELANAHLEQHQGVTQMLVRGLPRVTCFALLMGLAANLVHHAAHLLG